MSGLFIKFLNFHVYIYFIGILADTRLADRLSAAARERLSLAAKEKQLQVQRKQKAALFASMLKHSTNDGADTVNGACLWCCHC